MLFRSNDTATTEIYTGEHTLSLHDALPILSLIREESLKAMGGEISDLALQGLSIDLHGQSLADII